MYNIFISHSGHREYHYDGLVELLNKGVGAGNGRDYSIPKDDPVHCSSSAELKRAIESKIKCSSGVLVLAGVYATCSKGIDVEIDLAKKLGKPIIGVIIPGKEKISSLVKDNAVDLVKGNSESIKDAVKKHF